MATITAASLPAHNFLHHLIIVEHDFYITESLSFALYLPIRFQPLRSLDLSPSKIRFSLCLCSSRTRSLRVYRLKSHRVTHYSIETAGPCDSRARGITLSSQMDYFNDEKHAGTCSYATVHSNQIIDSMTG